MSDFRQQAELTKLARLSRCTPDSLEFLSALEITTLRKIRESVARLVVDKHRTFFSRVAAASKLLPMPLLAMIGERSLGPLLCARVAGEMPIPRAIEIARHFKPPFMAKTALYMETQKICEMTAALPLASVIAVTHELIAMREFIILGDLVDQLPLDLVSKVLATIHNGEALLRSAFYVENPARLVAMLDVLSDSTLRSLIRTAADEKLDLWPHALALMSVVPPAWQEKLVNMAVDDDDATLASMVNGVAKHDLWSTVMPLLDMMNDSGRQRLVDLPVLREENVIRHILKAAETHHQWAHLLPLIPLMDEPLQKRVGYLADELSADAIRTLAALADEKNLWAHTLMLAEHMGLVRRTTIAEILTDSNDEALTRLLATVHDNNQWHIALPLLATMSEQARHRFAALPWIQNDSPLTAIVAATEQHDLWATTLPLIDLMPDDVRQRLVNLPLFNSDNTIRHLLKAAEQHNLWQWLFPLTPLMSNDMRKRVGRLSDELSENAIRRMALLAHEKNLWAHGLLMAEHMGLVRRTTIAEILADSQDNALTALLQTIHDNQQWRIALPLLSFMSDKTQQRFVAHPFFQQTSQQQAIIDAAEQYGLWSVMLPLVKIMPLSVCESVTRIIDGLENEKLAKWISGVAEAAHWADAFDFMLTLSPGKKDFIALQICARDENSLQHMILSLVNAGRLDALLNHLQTLPVATQLQLVQRTQHTSLAMRQQLLVSVDDRCLDIILQRISELGEIEVSLFRNVALQLPDPHIQRLRGRCNALALADLLNEAP